MRPKTESIEQGRTRTDVGNGDWLAILRDAAAREQANEPTRFDVLAKAVKEIETLRSENEKLRELLRGVECREFSIECDLPGRSWWDERDAILANTVHEPQARQKTPDESSL